MKLITERLKTTKGKALILNVLLGFVFLFIYFGKVIVAPNTNFFASNGDGVMSYVTGVYHIEHDTTAFRTDIMNHPYGEISFFNSSQPFLVNTIDVIDNVIPIKGYTVGIINWIMIFSILFCGICLYILLCDLKVDPWIAAILSVAVTFLSPQIGRLSGHFALTYQFAIPLFLLLLYRFHLTKSLKYSLGIAFLTFFMSGTHFYFFGFFGAISLIYWVFLVFQSRSKETLISIGKQIAIHLVIPFVLVQLIVALNGNASDRTVAPWGILVYVSNWKGLVFPPGGSVFGQFVRWAYKGSHEMEWEGISYVGMIPLILMIAYGLKNAKLLICSNCRKFNKPTDSLFLNALIVCAILTMFYSFGWPFKWDMEWLLRKLGMLRQMRGIARFAWIMFYVANIYAIIRVSQYVQNRGGINRLVVLGLVVVVYFYEAHHNARGVQDRLMNKIEAFHDDTNTKGHLEWINQIDYKKYQAIIPLPYFHIGSENIWVGGHTGGIFAYTTIASIKTGLPSHGVFSSRTSLSETYNNYSLILPPYRKLKIIDDLPSKKPWLVIVEKGQHLTEWEEELIGNSSPIYENEKVRLLELSVEHLAGLHSSPNKYLTMEKGKLKKKFYRKEGELYCSDSLANIIEHSFEGKQEGYYSPSAYVGKVGDFNRLYDGVVPAKECEVSFWLKDFTTDLVPRGTIEILKFDKDGNQYDFHYGNPSKTLSQLDTNGWGRISINLKLRDASDKIRVTYWNEEFEKDREVVIDRLCIIPSGVDYFRISNGHLILNNRVYPGGGVNWEYEAPTGTLTE